MGMPRGMGCRQNMVLSDDSYWLVNRQLASRPASVFGFYALTDRAQGSNLLAPEQRLLNSNELSTRLGELNALRYNNATQQWSLATFTAAGCAAEAFVRAYKESIKAYNDLVSQRYFRGAMPPTLRASIERQINNPQWNAGEASEAPMRMLAFALSTPYYGAIK